MIEQLPSVSVQVFELNVTEPAPDWDQVMVPVGEYPVTFAVHFVVFDESVTKEEDLQVTEVVVACVETVRSKVPVLPRLLLSPEYAAEMFEEETAEVGL